MKVGNPSSLLLVATSLLLVGHSEAFSTSRKLMEVRQQQLASSLVQSSLPRRTTTHRSSSSSSSSPLVILLAHPGGAPSSSAAPPATGFIDTELRGAAMRLHTRMQASKEGQAAATKEEKAPNTGSGGAGDGGGGAEHHRRYQAESNPGKSQMKARPRMMPIRFSREKTNKQGEHQRQQAQTQHEEALHNDPTFLTTMDFSQLPDIHIATKRAIAERLGYRSMTEIQAQTFGPILAGRSVLAQSRTGHGKTLAFLLPTLERLLKSNEHYGQSVRVLIVSPTRELALQIAETASTLVTYHTASKHDNSSLNVLCLFGGTKYAKDVALLSHQSIPAILVCTPGRLVDHLETTRIRGRKFCDLFATTSVLVLDEADALLQGFSREMKKIVHYLPRSDKRQTLLFSATLPCKLKRSFEWVLPEDYVTVDTSASNNADNKRNRGITHGSSETDTQVKQSYVLVRSMDSYISSLVSIILHFVAQRKTTTPAHKIMVFLPTARLVKFFTEWFQVGFNHTKESKQNNNPRMFQMHSRMSQSARRRASEDFRHAKHGVLFTTDISSRGMDYPDVTVVLQVSDTCNGGDHTDVARVHAFTEGCLFLSCLTYMSVAMQL